MRSFFRRLGFGRNGDQSTEAQNLQISKILRLGAEFVKIGYNPEEVNYLIVNYCQGEKLSNLHPDKLKAVEELLKEHLSIARQSIKFVSQANR